MDVIYEDNHLLIVNKPSGQLVQPDPSGEAALEQEAAQYLRTKYNKLGAAFVGVVHRIDRPVSGAVLLAKTSKALVRMNEQLRTRSLKKIYWAITENMPKQQNGQLKHYILRNPKNNKSVALENPKPEAKEAVLKYSHVKSSDKYHLLEIELITGRHHQIRAQLAAIGCNIKGDLKYGAHRSNPDGSISLHSRMLQFEHPVSKEWIKIIAPTPNDKLWKFFEQ